jgi:hypothetical protein
VVSFTQVSPPKLCKPLFPPHTRYTNRPSHSSRCYNPHNSGCGVQIIKLLIMKFSPLPRYFIRLRSKYFPQRHILKHPQPMSSLIVSDEVSHPNKTIGKIRVMYILVFKFLDSEIEDKRFCTECLQAFSHSNLLLISS